MILRNAIFVLIIILFTGLAVVLSADLLANIKKMDKHRGKSKSNTGTKTNPRKSRFI